MSPDDPRHGSRRGYYAHRAAGQDACDACKRGAASAEARRHLPGASKRIDPTGTARRIQALVALGWTYMDIHRETGIEDAEARRFALGERSYVYSTTRAKVIAAFDRLSMKVPPERTRGEKQARTKARRMAQRHDWAPPLAWEGIDIDNPNAKPDVGREATNWRAADLVAEWDHLRRNGLGIEEAARRLGITVDAIEKAIERARKEVA